MQCAGIAPVPRADLVLMESTYGDRLHRRRDETTVEIREVLEQAWASGGNVLIPAFAVGRSQELLYLFARQWDEWNLGRWRIFLDSPMAARVAAVYDRHVALFDERGADAWNQRPHPFRMPNLRMTVDAAQSRAINGVRRGAIVIAGSGMCNGGRIRHHLLHNLSLPQAHVLFVGYQAHGTLGRRLVDGAREVRLLGQQVPVRATMHTVGGLSAHADQAGLLDWAGAIDGRPPVVLVHGEDPARETLAALLGERGHAATLARPAMERDV